jgi:hypothetical protein
VRTLVISAGIAGLTLCQQGRPPVIAERPASVEGGYAIGLYPLGSCELHGLGSYEPLIERALVVDRYERASGSGRAPSAMRAAAGLADELSRANADTVPLALELDEKRRRSVIERSHTDSRRLARVMLVRRSPVSWARNQLARRYPAERALAEIIASAHRPF